MNRPKSRWPASHEHCSGFIWLIGSKWRQKAKAETKRFVRCPERMNVVVVCMHFDGNDDDDGYGDTCCYRSPASARICVPCALKLMLLVDTQTRLRCSNSKFFMFFLSSLLLFASVAVLSVAATRWPYAVCMRLRPLRLFCVHINAFDSSREWNRFLYFFFIYISFVWNLLP